MMSLTGAISGGLSCCWNTEGGQTTTSIGLRVTGVVLGLILIVGSILNLCGVPCLSQFGTTAGWIALSLGTFIVLVATFIKYIKKQTNSREGRQPTNSSPANTPAITTLSKKVPDVTKALSDELATNMSHLVNKKQIHECKLFVDIQYGETILFSKDYLVANLSTMKISQFKAYIHRDIMPEITTSFVQDADAKMQMSWGILTKNADKKFDFLLLSFKFDVFSTNFTLNRAVLDGATLDRVHDYLQAININRKQPEM